MTLTAPSERSRREYSGQVSFWAANPPRIQTGEFRVFSFLSLTPFNSRGTEGKRRSERTAAALSPSLLPGKPRGARKEAPPGRTIQAQKRPLPAAPAGPAAAAGQGPGSPQSFSSRSPLGVGPLACLTPTPAPDSLPPAPVAGWSQPPLPPTPPPPNIRGGLAHPPLRRFRVGSLPGLAHPPTSQGTESATSLPAGGRHRLHRDTWPLRPVTGRRLVAVPETG